MMTNCPTCGKEVDTIRARAVSLRDGKVIAFCSNECKAAGGTAPIVLPAAGATVALDASPTPSKRALDSSPVIEILHEPASGVVTSAPDRRDASAPARQTASASTAGSTTILDSKDEAKAKADAKAKDAKSREGKGKHKKGGKEAEPSTLTANGKTVPVAKAEDKAIDKPVAKPEAKPATEAAAAVPEKKHPKTFDAKAGTDTPHEGFRLNEFKSYEPDPSEKAKLEAEDIAAQAPAPKRGRALIVVIMLLLLGGGAAAFYKLVYAKRGTSTTPGTGTPTKVETGSGSGSGSGLVGSGSSVAEATQPSTVITSADAIARATAFLHGQLAAGTPHLQGKAAIALARTKDPKAVEVLATLMQEETNNTAKLDFAYALAKAGDKRGFAALKRGIATGDRDAKLNAGGHLVHLGAPEGAATLEDYLDVMQVRLSTAVVLASNKDPKTMARAITLLEKIRTDPKSTKDDQAQANIALGMSGQASVIPNLINLLQDDHFNLNAAEALAHLGDLAARPVLVKQLEITGLRLRAARALRVLEPKLDASPHLASLLAVVEADKADQGASEAIRVFAAETVLVLAGPAEWAEHE